MGGSRCKFFDGLAEMKEGNEGERARLAMEAETGGETAGKDHRRGMGRGDMLGENSILKLL